MQGCFRIVIIIIIVIVIIIIIVIVIIIIIVITPCSGLDFALLTARLESLVFLWPSLKDGRRDLRAGRANLSLRGVRPFPVVWQHVLHFGVSG